MCECVMCILVGYLLPPWDPGTELGWSALAASNVTAEPFCWPLFIFSIFCNHHIFEDLNYSNTNDHTKSFTAGMG